MDKEVQQFLEAEKVANELVQTLQKLHIEAESYQSARKELDTVRQHIINLVESISAVANGTYDVVKLLQEIGGPEILKRLKHIQNRTQDEFGKLSSSLGQLRTLIIITLLSSLVAIVLGIVGIIK